MRKAIGVLATIGLLSVTSAAFAQGYGYSAGYSGSFTGLPPSSGQLDNIGNAGQLVISAERITGLSFNRDKTSFAGQDHTDTSTAIGLFSLLGTAPSTFPRIGLDYFVVDSLSVGISGFYLHESAGPGGHVLLLNPRVGYAYAFDDTFSVWPRLGITYADEGNDSHGLALTAEGMFGVSPVSHLVLFGGPFLDLGLSGKQGPEDFKQTAFGLTFGLGGYIPI